LSFYLTAHEAIRGQVADAGDAFAQQLAIEQAKEVAARAEATQDLAGDVRGIRDEPMYDLQKLVDLLLGQSSDLGKPIEDLSESGPLGTLWPRGQRA